MKKISLLIILLCSTLSFGQSKKFTLLDKESKETLAFANIVSGKFGTISNADGKFELDLSRIDSELKISYIGYKDIRVPVENLQELETIFLERKTEALEEVVLHSIDDILQKFIDNLSTNYPDEAINELFFYRATLLKNQAEGQLNEGFIKTDRIRYFKNSDDNSYEILSVQKQNDLEELNYKYLSFQKIFELSNGFVTLDENYYDLTTENLDEYFVKVYFKPKDNITLDRIVYDGFLIIDISNYAVIELNYSMADAFRKTIKEREISKSFNILDKDVGKIIKWEKDSKTGRYLISYMLIKEGIILIDKKKDTRDNIKVYYELQNLSNIEDTVLSSKGINARKNRSIFQYRDFNTESPLWETAKPLLRNKEQNIIIEDIK